MAKVYTESELRAIGMSESQIEGIMNIYKQEGLIEGEESKDAEDLAPVLPIQMHHHDVEVKAPIPLVPTSITQIAEYKKGTVVELPSFGDGQPFVARVIRPSLPALIRSGRIPNSLLNQATSLFANGTNALNASGKNAVNVDELFVVIDAIVEAALLEPTVEEIRSVGMELTDDQLMAIFAYTQKGVKALEQFRTK